MLFYLNILKTKKMLQFWWQVCPAARIPAQEEVKGKVIARMIFRADVNRARLSLK